jgi:hypothetical protein
VTDAEATAETASRYAAGMAWIGTRRLSPAEVAGLRRSWRHARVVDLVQLLAVAGATTLAAFLVATLAPAFAMELGGRPGIAIALLGLAGVTLSLSRLQRGLRIGVALALIACLGVSVAWGPSALASNWLRVPWIAIVLVGTGVIALEAWMRLRLQLRGRRIATDLRDGVVDCHAGFVGGAMVDELRRLWRASGRGRAPQLPHDAPAQLDVLPTSGVAVSFCGRTLARFETVHVAEVAAARPHAFRTALPRGVIQVRSPARLQLQRRSLTPAESAEITAHIKSLRRQIWPALTATIAVAVVIGARLWIEGRWEALLDSVALGWYALALVAYIGYGRRIVAARKLEFDRELRWVVTVDDPHKAGDSAPKLEVLPVSHLAWTENAAPAPWRLCRL